MADERIDLFASLTNNSNHASKPQRMDPKDIERIGAAAEFVHPAELIEPDVESTAHADRVRLLQILSGAMTWVHRAESPRVGAWQVVYALGLQQATRPMIDVAAELGVERATISGGACRFLKLFDPPIPPSPAMRSELASIRYRERRIKTLKEHEHHRTSKARSRRARV